MARNNKYTSLNFNEIYEKKITNTSSAASNNSKLYSSSSAQKSSVINPNKTILSNSRIHGHMLVLSRPTPKPISVPTPAPSPSLHQKSSPPSHLTPNQPLSEPDSISLRPLGRTGSGPAISSSSMPSSSSPLTSSNLEKQMAGLSLPKTDRFVPPHLRPGFVARQEKPGPELQRQIGARNREENGGHRQGHFMYSPNRQAEDRRPKSGGGYERLRRKGDSDPVDLNRPRSSGTRPNSSG